MAVTGALKLEVSPKASFRWWRLRVRARPSRGHLSLASEILDKNNGLANEIIDENNGRLSLASEFLNENNGHLSLAN